MSAASGAASSTRHHNLIARFARWLFFLPGRYVVIIAIAVCVQVVWWGHDILSAADPMLVPRHLQQEVIPSEMREGLQAVLTPAQQEYVATHLLTALADLMAELSDWAYIVSQGDERIMASLFTVALSGVIVVFRMGISMFLMISAFLIGLAAFVAGRYEFYRVWRESRVPDASGTWFAIAWQTKSAYPWVLLAFLAIPWGAYGAYMWFVLFWAAATGYVMGRTFTDRL